MKDLEEIIKQQPVYLHDWAKSKRTGVISDFEDIYIPNTQNNEFFL